MECQENVIFKSQFKSSQLVIVVHNVKGTKA